MNARTYKWQRYLAYWIAGACWLVGPSAVLAIGARKALPPAKPSLSDATARIKSLPNGFEVDQNDRSVRVTATLEGVFRIQMAPSPTIAPNPSWAVVAEPPAKIQVTIQNNGNALSFVSGGSSIKVDLPTLAITVLDPAGRVITQDEPSRLPEFHGAAFRVFKSMPQSEHFFALGDKAGPTDHRDEAFTLWNTDAYHWQEATDPLYKSIPFFLAMHDGISYGIFLDDTWRSSFDFGKEARNYYSFGAEGGQLDYYIITGNQPKDIVRRFTELTGRPAMPPRWALGYQQSRWSYYPESRVREVADTLRRKKIPADVIYLDIDYQDRDRPFTVDRTHYPNFEQMITDLRAQHFHTVAITDLHIANAPKGEYSTFDSGLAGDHFIHNPDGSVYVGSVWPGPSSFPEFTQASSRAWWGSQYADFYVRDKIGGFWNDMNEPSVFNVATKTMPLTVLHRIDEPGWPKRTATHAEIHNVMGMLNSRGTYEGLLKLQPNQRPFVLTRASYAGGQRYAATWTGDNSATWNHLRIGTHQLINLGLSGFAFAGNDIGGYAGSPSMDLLTRWFEIGAFAPIDRDHAERGSLDKEPWVGGPEHEAIRRHYIEERYRLIPYIYTLAEQANREGIPLMRPLFLEFPLGRRDGAPMDATVDNQYMFGPALMIAPPPFPEVQDGYDIFFPENTSWFDYWTGYRVTLQRSPDDPSSPPLLHHQHPALDDLPVYVRAGSVLARQPLTQSTDEVPSGPLELRVYLPEPDTRYELPHTNTDDRCEGSLYTDDGESLNFQHGDFYRASVICTRTTQQFTVSISAAEGHYTPWWKELDVAVLGLDKKPSEILLNGKPVSADVISFENGNGVLHVRFPASRSACTLTVQQ